MQFYHFVLLLIQYVISIETRSAWVYSVNPTRSDSINNTSLKSSQLVNVSSSDVKTFVKVLTLLRKQLENEIKEQNMEKDWKRTMLKCTEFEKDTKEEIGVILPIPDPLEDLTLLSLLYDETANWSKCTRSCKSKRLRKCRARGLCSMDYLLEEAFCFFPESRCEKTVEKLIKNITDKKKQGDDEDDKVEPEDYDEEYYDNGQGNHQNEYAYNNEDYDHHTGDYSHTSENYDDDDGDYEYKHGESHHNYYGHNDHDDDYYQDDISDYYGDTETDDWNSFWENDDYTYGDPNYSYDCKECHDDDNYDDYEEPDAEEIEEEDQGDDKDDGVCGSTNAGVPKRSFRIIGGNRAVKGSWPWQVSIVDRYGVNYCGGTIIAPRWVLTAAHCIRPRIRVKIAEHDVSRFDGEIELKVRRSFKHPDYNRETYDRDLALIKLPKSVFTTDAHLVKKACLPKTSSQLPKKQSCVVLGWGKEKETHIYGSDILMYAKVPIVSDSKCYEAYADMHMTKHMFCAGYLRGGSDTCSGDSGGPLLCQDTNKKWVIHGVTSFGEGCAKSGRYGVYAHVKNFLSWINSTMSEN